MTRRTPRLASILAGTALALLMAAPAGAVPARSLFAADTPGEGIGAGRLLLIQDEGDQEAQPEDDGEAKPRGRRKRERQEQGAQAEQPGAQEEDGGQETPRQRRRREAAEQAAQKEAQPKQAEEKPEQAGESPRQRRKREQQDADQQRQQNDAQQNDTDEQSAAQKRQRERQELANRRQSRDSGGATVQSAPEPEEAAEPEQTEESPRQRRQREQREAEQRAGEQQAEKQRRQQEAAPKPEAAPQSEQAEESPRQRRQREQREAEQRAGEQQVEKQRRQQEAAPKLEAAPQPEQAEESPRDRRRREQQKARQREQQAERDRQQADGENRRGDAADAAALPPGEAPSADAQQRDTPEEGQPVRRPRREQADNAPPPVDDRAAQQEVRSEPVGSVNAEEGSGRRESRRNADEPQRRERPSGTDVLREIGDRLIVRYNDQVLVESDDAPRMQRNARDVYVEDLPRQRTRETVTRPDGTRVVTIRNRFGDVTRRSRITEDGREYVLNYVDEEDTDRARDWRDPGLDLPPFRPNVPERDYILDAEQAPTSDEYYDFLEKPPVERVERLYSLDEVKRSARVRQKTRRVDLDTVTFDFGSAAVPESQINKLEGVASAMERLLTKNPAETFLIEGHTDAVGSEEANLALSDRRAEAVAEALTSVFDIPPENLATQGYGEQYLKVSTNGAEKENRRVAIRRITPLVAPVASAE